MNKKAASILIVLAIVIILGAIGIATIVDLIFNKHELIIGDQQISVGDTTAGELMENGYEIYSFDDMAPDFQQHLDSGDYYKINLKKYKPVDGESFKISIKSDSRVSERTPFILSHKGRYHGSIGFYYGDKSKEVPIKDGKITSYKFCTDGPKTEWPDITIYLSKHRFKNRASMWHKEKLTDVTVNMLEKKYNTSSIKEDYYNYTISRKLGFPKFGSFKVETEFSEEDLNRVTMYSLDLFDS